MSDVLRIAVWSGPRNISTAMMRAWENRPDCAVVDEPFYAHYLAATGAAHPAREEVIAAGETDWRREFVVIPSGQSNLMWITYCNSSNRGANQAWVDQLAVGGRIVAPMVTPAGQQALVVIEHASRDTSAVAALAAPTAAATLSLEQSRRYGDTTLTFFAAAPTVAAPLLDAPQAVFFDGGEPL